MGGFAKHVITYKIKHRIYLLYNFLKMIELIFATNNQNKAAEINKMVSHLYRIITLKEAGIDIDIPEPYETLKENAFEKSITIHRLTGKNCFSEDTGLFVKSLHGEPGVKSARYAGEGKTTKDNIDKLLTKLDKCENRDAFFQTIISLIINNEQYYFEGICKGTITTQFKGESGFGYDPIFVPDGATKTFAEMTTEDKNTFSHRKEATLKLIHFLSHYGKE